jgi:hypothetical protein
MDWQDMFRRYSDLVGEYEGIEFLYENDWTPEEWVAIQELLKEK